MFTFPPSKWVGGIFYEHGHRLIASTVGFLTIILAVWLWLADPRRWMRWLGVAALGAVDRAGRARRPDGALLPAGGDSTAHAGLAEIFFCLTVAIALFTSPGWIERLRRRAASDDARRSGAPRDGDDRRSSTRRSSSARRCGIRAPAWRFRTFR